MTVTTQSAEKPYDGTALTAPGTVTGYKNNETATFTVTGSQTEVGSSSNTYTLVFDKTAASTDYTISESRGTLKVTDNVTTLTIVSATDSKEYDGSALTAPTYTITYGETSGTATLNAESGKYEYKLSTGDVIAITPATTTTVTHVAEGTVKNAFSYTLKAESFY